jgi:hypothetical protein
MLQAQPAQVVRQPFGRLRGGHAWGALKRIGIALIVGAALVGIAGIVALAAGNDARFFQGCALIALVCVAAAVIMSGSMFVGGSYPSRAAMTQLPAPAADRQSDDPVDSETRSRLNSVYPLVAGLPSIAIALLHYL